MTNKIALRTREEFMADFKPVYAPIFPMFLGKSQQWEAEVGKLDFKRADSIGDIRLKHITPKDTEMKQVLTKEGSKTFKKYFLAKQFRQSSWQDAKGNEDIIGQVLDENNKLADDLLLLGEGTSASTMINNGLFWSADANYDLENSVEVAIASSSHLVDLHAKVITAKLAADLIAGRKVVIFYGSTMLPKVNSLYATSTVPFKSALSQVLGANYSVMDLPADVTPSGANGFMVVNLDQVMLHYTLIPQLLAQGVNDEAMYTWHNFAMGSMMLEVLADNAIIRQPTTFGA